MAEDFVSLKQLATELGMDRSHARRYVLRLGFTPHKRRTADSQNQLTLAVTIPEAEVIRNKRREAGFFESTKPVVSEVGVFYVIRLVPELEPRRLKLGFADDLPSRLGQHRTAAPTAVRCPSIHASDELNRTTKAFGFASRRWGPVEDRFASTNTAWDLYILTTLHPLPYDTQRLNKVQGKAVPSVRTVESWPEIMRSERVLG